MAETAIVNFETACDVACTLDYANIAKFRSNEVRLNFLNKELARFMAKLMKADLNERDRNYLSTAFRTVTDLERVGDYAENIVEYADKLKEAGERFSDDAVGAYEIEERVDDVAEQMTANHIKRLSDGECTPEVGTQYLSLATNAERVADHYINVAKSIKVYSGK